jgi:hypothetical protein
MCNFTSTKTPGKLIIKAIEPLTFRYIKNFRDYLYNQILDVRYDTHDFFVNKNGNNMRYTSSETTLTTKMDYNTFSLKDKNCAGFIEILSHKKKFNTTSVTGKLGGIISNPSNMAPRFFTFNGLNRFVGEVIENAEAGSVVSWLRDLYTYLY